MKTLLSSLILMSLLLLLTDGAFQPVAQEQTQSLPIESLVELTVCPDGPPICQFKKIQDAIDAAPETGELSPSQRPKIPRIQVAAGVYLENLRVLKSIWLQGVERDQVTIRGVIKEAPAVLAVGPQPIVFVAEGITVENQFKGEGLRLQGKLTTFVVDSAFQNNTIGILGLGTSGVIAIGQNWIKKNLFAGISMQGISADQRFQRSISLSIGANLIEENLDPSLPVRPNLGTYNGVGIWLQDVQDAVVANNTIRKSGLGTFALKSNDIKYSGNKITETAGAFLLFDTLSFSLYNNTFSENDGGLFIGGGFGGGQESCKGAIFSEIWGNQIINNKGAGISLCAVNKLKLFDNVISGNEYGLFILFSENLAEQDFTCERNRVVDNTKGNYVAFNFSTVNPLSLIQPNEALRKKCEGN